MLSVDIIVTLTILAVTLLLFVLDRWPIDLVSLLCLSALLVTGRLSPSEGFEGFSNPVTVTIACLFILSAGLQRCGTLDPLSEWITRGLQRDVRRVTGLLLLSVGLLSAFMNNTAVVAIFLPVVMKACRKAGASPSKFLIPVSFSAMLGGMCTLIGTSTNLIVSEASGRLLGEPFSMFEMTAVGASLFAVGWLYLVLIAPRLLPDRRVGRQLVQDFEATENLHHVVLNSADGARPLQGWRDLRALTPDILSLQRAGQPAERPETRSLLEDRDALTLRSDAPVADCAEFSRSDLKVTDDMLESEDSVLIEALVQPGRDLDGHNLKEAGLSHPNLVPIAIRHKGHILHRDLSQEVLKSGDTVLFSVQRSQLSTLLRGYFTVVNQTLQATHAGRRRAALIVSLVVVGAALGLAPISVAAVLGSVAMLLSGCLSPEEAYQSVEWRVIVLLAAMFGLGQSMENSGATRLLSHWLEQLSGGPTATLVLVYLVALCLTSVLSNAATAVLLAPVAVNLAHHSGVEPKAALVILAIASSSCFLTPIGYQTNTMVYGPGHYTFTDFIKVGLPLNIALGILVIVLAPVLF